MHFEMLPEVRRVAVTCCRGRPGDGGAGVAAPL